VFDAIEARVSKETPGGTVVTVEITVGFSGEVVMSVNGSSVVVETGPLVESEFAGLGVVISLAVLVLEMDAASSEEAEDMVVSWDV
jgi:hypothetical protein